MTVAFSSSLDELRFTPAVSESSVMYTCGLLAGSLGVESSVA